MRPRSVPEPIVIQSHRQIQKKYLDLMNIFGSRTMLKSTIVKRLKMLISKSTKKFKNFRSKPYITNGKDWIE